MKSFGPKSRARYVCAIVFAAASILIRCELRGQTDASAQWLVLNNGQTLEGAISLVDGRYNVVTDSGSKIIVAEDKVSFVADSIEDIYWDRWSRVDPTDGTSHIGLFRWCLKHGLMQEAQNQIDLVAKLPNLENQAGHLSRMAQELELVVARKQKEASVAKQREIDALNIVALPKFPGSDSTDLASAPRIPTAPIDAEGRPIRRIAPSNSAPPEKSNTVELVGFEEEVKSPAQRNKPAWISNRKLDQETRSLPKGTVSFYKKHLEQKLISNCVKCHDSRSNSMPLVKRSFGQTIPRRMSQQNLHFVMEQVDRQNPLESPIIQMAVTAHGNQKSAAFQEADPYLFDLKKWAIAVSDSPSKWLMQLSAQSHSALSSTPSNPIEEQLDLPFVEDLEDITIGDGDEVDPYDPAAFNKK